MSLAAAVAYGVVAGTACNFATQLKYLVHYDDALDVNALSSYSLGLELNFNRSLRLMLSEEFVEIS